MRRAESLARRQPESPTRPVVVLAMDDEDMRAMDAYAIAGGGFDVAFDERGPAIDGRDSAPRRDGLIADLTHACACGRKLKSDGPASNIPAIAIAADVEPATRER